MKVIESYINSKSGDMSTCEDGLYIGPHFVAVVDGATSNKYYAKKKSGQVARDLIVEAFPLINKDFTAEHAIAILDGAISKWYQNNGLYDSLKTDQAGRCMASVVIYSKRRNELWFVGEAQALVDGKHLVNEKLVDQLFAQLRAFYLESEILSGKTVDDLLADDTGRTYVLPLIMRQYLFQNTDNPPFSFDVLDGFFNGEHKVRVVKVPGGTHELVLASDGYPKLCTTLEATETELTRVLQDDPLCFRENKQVKSLLPDAISFDDRAYVRLVLAGSR